MRLSSHYVDLAETNLQGYPLRIYFSTRVVRGELHVNEDLAVKGWCDHTGKFRDEWVGAETRSYPMDTVEGRDRLAEQCVSPAMLETGK